MSKSKILSILSRYRKMIQSADRLKRVQEIARFTAMEMENGASFDTDMQLLIIHDPVVTLVHSDQRIWLAVGEINGIRYNSQSLQRVGHSLLGESALKVSIQVLGLRPATSDDDPEKVHDWRTYTMPCESLTIPAWFIEPLDPEVHTGPKPFYLFKTPFLIAQTSLLIQRL
ncbi:hypothetical protein DFP72DRAFT_757747, partial [Ephemerocybe angulata]